MALQIILRRLLQSQPFLNRCGIQKLLSLSLLAIPSVDTQRSLENKRKKRKVKKASHIIHIYAHVAAGVKYNLVLI